MTVKTPKSTPLPHASTHANEDPITSLGGITMKGNFTPDAASTRQIGTSSVPLLKVYADELHGTTYYADIVFEEKTCGVCGKKFAVGDNLVLRVTEAEEKGVHTVPIHKECAGEGK